MIPRLKPTLAFSFIVLTGTFVLAQMGLYVAHEFWNLNVNWNIFQYCLSNLKEGSWSHTLVKLTFNTLILYTAVRILWKIGRQLYLSWKWFGVFGAKKHHKWTKRLNYKYRHWKYPIIVVQDAAFIAMAIGWLRPRIVISTGLLNIFQEEEIKAILLHERFHCANYDPLKTLVSTILQEGMNYVPALKGLVHYYKTWAELLADRFVIRQMGDSYPLGKVLLRLSNMTNTQRYAIGVHFANIAINYRMLQVIEPDKKIRIPFFYLREVLFSTMILALMTGVVVGGCS